jgi:UDP-N-acetylmuramyl pentapeptide phosphotransferase/UDP-N-acetylglucosamine-1-phosphate transferase
LARYALARPTARSSHREPTPQGGGIAVMAAMVITLIAAGFLTPGFATDAFRLAIVLAAALGLAAVGATDDIRPMEAVPRLVLQAIAVFIVIAALPHELRVFPILPWWVERALMLIGILWFVNLVNFMDGIDWMTVAEVVPASAALVVMGTMGALPGDGTVVALALLGAMIGFAPFNRPVARLFLGDVGSLPIGLLLAWLLVLLAGNGHLVAAALLPLYYVADTTLTLLRRLIAGEPVMQAHRSHFYQRATDRGFSVYQIVSRVFIVNVVLAGLAITTLSAATRFEMYGALAAGCAMVVILLWSFASGKTDQASA